MKTNVYLGIAIRIIILFAIGILLTYIPDHLRGFFGDTQFKSYITGSGRTITSDGEIDTQWVWGVRHYWYFTMMVFLFILSTINIIIGIRNIILKNYPNTKF